MEFEVTFGNLGLEFEWNWEKYQDERKREFIWSYVRMPSKSYNAED